MRWEGYFCNELILETVRVDARDDEFDQQKARRWIGSAQARTEECDVAFVGILTEDR